MNVLNYETLKQTGYDGFILENAPERILQFGEGNFLRAFVDYFVDVMNEKAGFNGKAVLCQPISNGLSDMINNQQGLYTLYLRGFENGQRVNQKRVISSVSRCINPYEDYAALLECAKNPDLRFIASNTTEAGIVYDANSVFDDAPPASFPAKLTRFLYERFTCFKGAAGTGFIVLSCELIDNNGAELEKCVKRHIANWKLSDDFAAWVDKEVVFCSTLVDRIVTGYPKGEADALNAENGYTDNLLNTAECFGFWVIEGPESIKAEFPAEKAGLPVLVTNNHKPYKQRKVRILNGAHTTMVLAAYLAGQDIVRDCMDDPVIAGYMEKTIHDEIIPTLTLPRQELEDFAHSVSERFKNPFIDHALLSIALNSTSKWRARVLPTLKDFVQQKGTLPPCITFSFAAYMAFYMKKSSRDYAVQDDDWVLAFYEKSLQGKTVQEAVTALCQNTQMWGEDLTAIPGFAGEVTAYIERMEAEGIYEVMRSLL